MIISKIYSTYFLKRRNFKSIIEDSSRPSNKLILMLPETKLEDLNEEIQKDIKNKSIFFDEYKAEIGTESLNYS